MLVGSVVRGEEVIIALGETGLKPGDHLVIFALPGVYAHYTHTKSFFTAC